MKFCLLFNLSPCARYCLLIGSQLTTWSQGNLHYIGLHFFQLDREFFCLLPSLARLYSAAASPSERRKAITDLFLVFIAWTNQKASHVHKLLSQIWHEDNLSSCERYKIKTSKALGTMHAQHFLIAEGERSIYDS